MRALIFDGQIVDVAAADFPVHPSMQWVAAPADVSMATHVFSGGAIVVKPPKTQTELNAEQSAVARQKLAEIDAKSIRAIREYIASKADAPAILKTHETSAQTERAKIKP